MELIIADSLTAQTLELPNIHLKVSTSSEKSERKQESEKITLQNI